MNGGVLKKPLVLNAPDNLLQSSCTSETLPTAGVTGWLLAKARKSIKALNHKDTKAQRKAFLPARRSSDKPRKNVVSWCLCGSLLVGAFCDLLLREDDGQVPVKYDHDRLLFEIHEIHANHLPQVTFANRCD